MLAYRKLDDLRDFAPRLTILTVDPTFNLGEILMSPQLLYRHGLLVSIRTGNPPVLMGQHSFIIEKHFTPTSFSLLRLIGLRKQLQGLRAFGTEKALVDAFAHKFRYAVHLTCFIHCRKNVKQKLEELKMKRKRFLMTCNQGDIFVRVLLIAPMKKSRNKIGHLA